MRKFLFFLSFFLFLFSLISLSNSEEIQISGSITAINNKTLIINNQDFELNSKSILVFKNQKSSQVINLCQVPLGGFAKGSVSGKQINYLEISGDCLSIKKEKVDNIYEFKEYLDEYAISFDGQFLAYFSGIKKQLLIIELSTGEEIWQKDFPLQRPVFKFGKQSPQIIYSWQDRSYFGLETYNYQNQNQKTIYQEKIINNEFINYFQIAPNELYLAMTIISGNEASQGVNSHIRLLDKNGFCLIIRLPHVYRLHWSNDSSLLAFTKFSDNLEGSFIGYYDLFHRKIIIHKEDQHLNYSNPIFSDNQKYLFYNQSNPLQLFDQIILFDFALRKETVLLNEINQLDDFCLLDQNNLVFTAGSVPEIKILQLNKKEIKYLGNGFAPQAINNILFFLSHSSNCETYLAAYNMLPY